MSKDEIWDECWRIECGAKNKSDFADAILARWNLDHRFRFTVNAYVYKELPHKLVDLLFDVESGVQFVAA